GKWPYTVRRTTPAAEAISPIPASGFSPSTSRATSRMRSRVSFIERTREDSGGTTPLLHISLRRGRQGRALRGLGTARDPGQRNPHRPAHPSFLTPTRVLSRKRGATQ